MIGRGRKKLLRFYFRRYIVTSKVLQEAIVEQSVKLADGTMTLVRREAELSDRSISDQISHWVKIDSAVERSDQFGHSRTSPALADEIGVASPEEEAWVKGFVENMGRPTAAEIAFHARSSEVAWDWMRTAISSAPRGMPA